LLFVVVISISCLPVILIKQLVVIWDQAISSPSATTWTPMGDGEGFAVVESLFARAEYERFVAITTG
jgi:hypothetical protein